jgi:hypothetical protein
VSGPKVDRRAEVVALLEEAAPEAVRSLIRDVAKGSRSSKIAAAKLLELWLEMTANGGGEKPEAPADVSTDEAKSELRVLRGGRKE